MKKVIASLVILGSFSAYANMQILWSGTEGFVRNDGNPIGTGFAEGASVYLAQLLYSPSGIQSGVMPGGLAMGDNEVISTIIVPNAEEDFAPLQANSHNEPFRAGFIFARVFDAGSFDSVNIIGGMFYYDGPTAAIVQQSDPSVVQAYSIHTSSAGIPGFETDILNLQVIPEPSVMALLGLGGLMLAIRRQRMAA